MKPSRRFTKTIRPVPTDCPFDKTKTEPDYKDVAALSKYVTERGKILPRSRTGLCNQHQRSVTREVKRSRYVGLMSFVVRA